MTSGGTPPSIWDVFVVIGIVVVVVLCLGAVAWIDYRQSVQSVRRGGRASSPGSRLGDARRSARTARARSRRRYHG